MNKSHAQSHSDALMSGRSQFRFRLYTVEGTRNAIRALADHIRMTPTLILLAAMDISVDPA
jgi:hypothetical protein